MQHAYKILGGGFSGLCVAKHLREKMPTATINVVDRDDHLGGLCQTAKVGDCLVDSGGSHIMFSKDTAILNEMVGLLGKEVGSRDRRAVVRLREQLIPYPIENGLATLDEKSRLEFANSMESAGPVDKSDYESYCRTMFGDLLFDEYFKPYNEKIWKVGINELSCSMLSRIPAPDAATIKRVRDGQYTAGYEEQSRFYYPQYGIGALSDAIKESASINVMSQRDIDVDDLLAPDTISTLPLPTMYSMLMHGTLKIDGVGLATAAMLIDTPRLKQYFHWLYEPSAEYEFNRVSNLTNYSESICPHGKTLLLFEMTTPLGKDKMIPHSQMHEWATTALGIDGKIIDEWQFDYAYPSPTAFNERVVPQAIRDISNAAPKLNVFGRFANWKYQNMDAIYKESKAFVGGI